MGALLRSAVLVAGFLPGAVAAAVYVPTPVPLYDGLTGRTMTLAEIGGIHPDLYVTLWKGVGPMPPTPSSPTYRVPLPCRPGEYDLPENYVFCGWPAALTPPPRVAAPPPWHEAGQGGGGRSPAPVPLPASVLLLAGAIGGLFAVRRRGSK